MKKSIAAAATLIAIFAASGCSAPSSGPAVPGSTQSESATNGDGGTPAAPAEVTYYDNGDLIVGTDIKPGVYRGEVDEGIVALCTASQTTEAGKVMDIRNANSGKVVFTVKNVKGSVVSFSGFSKVTKVG